MIASFVLSQVSCASEPLDLLSGSYTLSGDQSDVTVMSDGNTLMIGQKGSGKFIEGYSLSFTAPDGKDISIAYRSHIQDAGWYQWQPSGTQITYQPYFAVDTFQMMTYGRDAFMYEVSYRVAAVGEDWQEWVSDGAMTGEADEHRPIEAIEIRFEPREGYEPSTWTLTQYSDDSDQQSMFYTMRNNDDGTLIVVDGGYPANTDQVRAIINLYGGHVDHWFLTHYDEDHASVLNGIYGNLCGITIDNIYATPLDYDYYMSFAVERWWDTPWVYEEFLRQTEGDERVHYLSRGDSFEIDGLRIDVFNAYDQVVVDTGDADVANLSSLMFKITGVNDSILFCGDVHGGFGMTLLDMYGDALRAEYVQPGHHGNNSIPREFYEALEPEVMLFDGPPWLTQTDTYTAKALIEWCHENGIETYEFESAPNSFAFE